MRYSSVKIEKLLIEPSAENILPNQFYLIENIVTGLTKLFLSNSSSQLILLNEAIALSPSEIAFGGDNHTLAGDPTFTYSRNKGTLSFTGTDVTFGGELLSYTDTGLLSVDRVSVLNDPFGDNWQYSTEVPTKESLWEIIGPLLDSGVIYTDEQAQDAVGNILTNTSTINFNYNDPLDLITADVNDASITLAKIANAVDNSRLLGSGSAGSGFSYSEIEFGAGLGMDGTTLSAAFASSSVYGITSLTRDPEVLTQPKAVASNDLIWEALGDSVYLDSYGNDWTAALTAITDAGNPYTDLIVTDALVPVTADLSTPSNVRVRFDGEGSVDISSGVTFNIAALADPGPRRVAHGLGDLILGKNAMHPIKFVIWAGLVGDGIDNTHAYNQAFLSASNQGAVGGGVIEFGPGSWAGSALTIPNAVTLSGAGRDPDAGSYSPYTYFGTVWRLYDESQEYLFKLPTGFRNITIQNGTMTVGGAANASCLLNDITVTADGLDVRNVAFQGTHAASSIGSGTPLVYFHADAGQQSTNNRFSMCWWQIPVNGTGFYCDTPNSSFTFDTCSPQSSAGSTWLHAHNAGQVTVITALGEGVNNYTGIAKTFNRHITKASAARIAGQADPGIGRPFALLTLASDTPADKLLTLNDIFRSFVFSGYDAYITQLLSPYTAVLSFYPPSPITEQPCDVYTFGDCPNASHAMFIADGNIGNFSVINGIDEGYNYSFIGGSGQFSTVTFDNYWGQGRVKFTETLAFTSNSCHWPAYAFEDTLTFQALQVTFTGNNVFSNAWLGNLLFAQQPGVWRVQRVNDNVSASFTPNIEGVFPAYDMVADTYNFVNSQKISRSVDLYSDYGVSNAVAPLNLFTYQRHGDPDVQKTLRQWGQKDLLTDTWTNSYYEGRDDTTGRWFIKGTQTIPQSGFVGLDFNGDIAALNFKGDVREAAELGGRADNWYPGGAERNIYVTSSLDTSITGLISDVFLKDGEERVLINGGIYTITISHEDILSAAASRFHVSGGGSVDLPPSSFIHLIYSITLQRWLVGDSAGGSYTDEQAQDAVGAMVDDTIVYTDSTPLLSRAALTGAITADEGSNATLLGAFTKSDLDAAVSDGDVLYVGDITQYTDEMAQDAVGVMIDSTLVYTDATPLLSRAALTGDVSSPAGSNVTTIGSNKVTLGMMDLLPAHRYIGNNTASPATPLALTTTEVKADLAITESDVSGLVSDLGLKAPLISPAFTGNPTAPTQAAADNSTKLATTAYADSAVAAVLPGLLRFRGLTNCSTNPNYPPAVKGDAYLVSVAGKIGGASGTSKDVGDWYIATSDNAGGTEASVGSSWGHMEHNLVGALLASNNLSDLASSATALTNLGLSANGASLVTAANYAAMKTLLSLVVGTNVQAWDADLDTWATLTPSANAQSLVTAANYSAMRTLLSLVPGTDIEVHDATLTALAGANWAANSLPIGSGTDTVSQVTFAVNTFPARASTGNLVAKTISDFALTFLDDADAAAVRTTIGAGTSSFSGAFSSLSGIPTTLAGYGITDAQPLDATLTALASANWVANAVPIGSGADTLSQVTFAPNTFPARSSTGNLVAKTITDFGLSLVDDSSSSVARSTLGLVIGTDVEAYSTDLSAIAGLTPSNDDLLQRKAGAWTNRTIAQVKADLNLRRVYNVKDYGAVGDGATNDSSSVASAISACSAAGGGTVYFPNSTYRVSGITYANNVFLEGESLGSTILKIPNSTNNTNVLNATTGFKYIGAARMTLDCGTSTGSKCFSYAGNNPGDGSNTYGVKFENVYFLNGQYATHFHWLGSGAQVETEIIGFDQCKYSGQTVSIHYCDSSNNSMVWYNPFMILDGGATTAFDLVHAGANKVILPVILGPGTSTVTTCFKITGGLAVLDIDMAYEEGNKQFIYWNVSDYTSRVNISNSTVQSDIIFIDSGIINSKHNTYSNANSFKTVVVSGHFASPFVYSCGDRVTNPTDINGVSVPDYALVVDSATAPVLVTEENFYDKASRFRNTIHAWGSVQYDGSPNQALLKATYYTPSQAEKRLFTFGRANADKSDLYVYHLSRQYNTGRALLTGTQTSFARLIGLDFTNGDINALNFRGSVYTYPLITVNSGLDISSPIARIIHLSTNADDLQIFSCFGGYGLDPSTGASNGVQFDGEEHFLINSGTHRFIIKNESSSAPGTPQRWLTNTGADMLILPGQMVKIVFDAGALTTGRWLVYLVDNYTDEMAQDAIGAMVDSTIVYTDATPLLSRAALTGDVTAPAGSNATTIANNAVTTAKIIDKAVTLAKMNDMATSSLIYRKTSGAGVPEVNTLATLKTDLLLTGTNSGDVTLSGENYLSLSGQLITANAVNLAGTNVTGTLPFSKGGTNSTSFTAGSIPYVSGSSSLVENNSNLFWDNNNFYLGLGTTSPARRLEIKDSASDFQLRLGKGSTNSYDIGRVDSTGLLKFYGNQTGFVGYIFDGINGEQARLTSTGFGINTTPSVKLHVISTTEQVRIGYDASNYFKTTVASTGSTTFDLVAGSGTPTFTFSKAISATNLSGTNTGDVTKSGENYLSLSGQAITANAVDLSGTNVTGTLAAGRFPALSGDISNTAGSLTTAIGANKVTLGMMATLSANSIVGNNTGSTATPIALTTSQTRSLLSLVVGTNVQAWSAELDTFAALTPTTGNFLVGFSGDWASRTSSQVRTTLGLVVGTNVQAWDADLDTLAGLTATTDNFIQSKSGAWASRTVAQVRADLGSPRVLFNSFVDVSNSGVNTTNTLYNYTLPAGTLATNGDSLDITYAGVTASNADNKYWYASFGGNSIFDSQANFNSLTSSGISWRADIMIMRVSSTVIRYTVTFKAYDDTTPFVKTGEVTGLTLSSTNAVVFECAAGAVSDITAKMARGIYTPGV